MRITALMENTAPQGALRCEHGLALLIEHGGKTWLLDAGATDALLENAAALGVDLAGVDAAVLSHAHFDHSGGFPAFFALNRRAPLYLRPQAAEASYEITGTERMYLGVPAELLAQSGRLRFVEGPAELATGVYLLPHSTPDLARRGERVHMYRQTAEGLVPDDFAHEQTLIFETGGALVLFSSCSHAGADHVVEEVLAAFPGKRVRAFFGGFHLMGAGGAATLGVRPERVEALGRRLMELGVEEIWTGHCTGAPAFELLKPVLGARLHALSTGTVVEL